MVSQSPAPEPNVVGQQEAASPARAGASSSNRQSLLVQPKIHSRHRLSTGGLAAGAGALPSDAAVVPVGGPAPPPVGASGVIMGSLDESSILREQSFDSNEVVKKAPEMTDQELDAAMAAIRNHGLPPHDHSQEQTKFTLAPSRMLPKKRGVLDVSDEELRTQLQAGEDTDGKRFKGPGGAGNQRNFGVGGARTDKEHLHQTAPGTTTRNNNFTTGNSSASNAPAVQLGSGGTVQQYAPRGVVGGVAVPPGESGGGGGQHPRPGGGGRMGTTLANRFAARPASPGTQRLHQRAADSHNITTQRTANHSFLNQSRNSNGGSCSVSGVIGGRGAAGASGHGVMLKGVNNSRHPTPTLHRRITPDDRPPPAAAHRGLVLGEGAAGPSGAPSALQLGPSAGQNSSFNSNGSSLNRAPSPSLRNVQSRVFGTARPGAGGGTGAFQPQSRKPSPAKGNPPAFGGRPPSPRPASPGFKRHPSPNLPSRTTAGVFGSRVPGQHHQQQHWAGASGRPPSPRFGLQQRRPSPRGRYNSRLIPDANPELTEARAQKNALEKDLEQLTMRSNEARGRIEVLRSQEQQAVQRVEEALLEYEKLEEVLSEAKILWDSKVTGARAAKLDVEQDLKKSRETLEISKNRFGVLSTTRGLELEAIQKEKDREAEMRKDFEEATQVGGSGSWRGR